MSGIESSVPAVDDAEASALLSFSVHSPPSLADAAAARRTARGRLVMLIVLAMCAAPVIASYVTYFVIRPSGRTNYGELVAPARPMPETLALTDLHGQRVLPASLRGQWLLVVVAGGACDRVCERQLWVQRQLHEALGRDKDRVEKVWLVDDAAAPRSETLRAIGASTLGEATAVPASTVLHVPRAQLAAWLAPTAGANLEDRFYIVDPQGDWMMRSPPDADPARLKRDIDKLLRASAGWDQAGR